MFSLIIVLVSIFLVAALALATLYYGGAFKEGAFSTTEASRYRNEGQQLLGAAELFHADLHEWPESLDQLLADNYLKSIPGGVPSPSGNAGWDTPKVGRVLYATDSRVPEEICRKFNKASRGDNGILTKAYTSQVSQCYGSAGAYRIIVGIPEDAAELVEVLGPDSALTGSIPSRDAGSSVWDKLPTESGADTGGIQPESPETPGGADTATPAPIINAVPFGTTAVGQTASAFFTVQNTSTSVALDITGVSVDGTGFGISDSGACLSIPAGGSCSFNITFTPAQSTLYQGTIKVAISKKVYTASISGQGYAPASVSSVSVARYATNSVISVVGENFPNNTSAYLTPASGALTVGVQDSTHLTVNIQNYGEQLSTAYLRFPGGQPDISLGQVDARGEVTWGINYGTGLTISADGKTALQGPSSNSEAYVSRTHSTGKWYIEAYYGTYGVLTLTGGAGGSRYLDGKWGDTGGPSTVLVSPTKYVNGARGRYGYAADTDAKTWSLIDLATCKTIGKWAFSGDGAYTLVFTVRTAYDGANNSATVYTSSTGTSCKPAGFNWW